MGVRKSLVETPQHVYSVVRVSVAQLKSTKTATCGSAPVFACWATARSFSVRLFDVLATVRARWTACTARTRLTLAKAAAARIPTLKTR